MRKAGFYSPKETRMQRKMQCNLFTAIMQKQFTSHGKCKRKRNTANTRHTESLTLFYLADEASHTHTHPKTQMKRNKKERDFPEFRGLPRVLAARVPSAHTDPQPKASTPTRRRTNRAPTRRRTNQFLQHEPPATNQPPPPTKRPDPRRKTTKEDHHDKRRRRRSTRDSLRSSVSLFYIRGPSSSDRLAPPLLGVPFPSPPIGRAAPPPARVSDRLGTSHFSPKSRHYLCPEHTRQ